MVSTSRQRHPTRSGSSATTAATTTRTTIHHPLSATDKPHLPKALRNSLLAWEHLPPWSQTNSHIHSHFRPISNSYQKCFASLFYLHNETGNIYTHLLGTVWILVLAAWYYSYAKERYPQAGQDDVVIFTLFFLGGAACFALSTLYHVLSNHSHTTRDFCHRLDFLGIIAVTSGCLPPGLWYTYPCMSRDVKITWIVLDLLAQFLAAIFVLFVKRFRTPAWRPLRGLLFSFMASSAFYPIIAAVWQFGWRRADEEYGASWYALTILIDLSGVAIYATRFPEAWKPGQFDVWGQSHQIFHISMVVGLTTHFMAYVTAVDNFYNIKGGKC